MLMRKLNIVLPIAVLFCLTAVSAVQAKPSDGTISFSGRIVHNDFEGGFFGIVADDGGKYDPINLPKDFQKAGMRVRCVVRPKPGMMSFHMWGRIVEIIKIEKVKKIEKIEEAAEPADPPGDDEEESPADRLRKTPVKITIGDQQLTLSGQLIRNLMPTIGPRRGSNTYLILRLKTTGQSLPQGLKCKTVYGVDGQKIWESAKLEVRPSPKVINIIARNTPSWRKPIDVIVKLHDADGNEYLIRAPGVKVMEVH